MTRQEATRILAVVVSGTVISYFAFDFYDTSLVSAKLVFLGLSICISVVCFYAMLIAVKAPVHDRLPGALWAAVPWNCLQLWQFPYIGFFFIPLEILVSGLLLRFRTGLTVWKAVGTSLVVRMTVFVIYYAV